MKLRGPAAALLLAAACSPATPPRMCTPIGGFVGPAAADFAVAGDILSVTMQLPVQCPEGITPRVTVSVQDPTNSNAPLFEGEATRDAEQLQNQGLQTVVKVRSTLPGPYHFTARFEPNLGLIQRDVIVAENHRDAGAELVIRSGSPLTLCPHVDVTPLGRPLCLTGNVRLFERDAGLLQVLGGPEAVAARVGDVLWVSEGPRLSRFVETPAGYQGAPDASFQPFVGNPVIAADPAGLFAARGQLWHIDYRDGGFVERAHIENVASNPESMWKRGDEFVIIGGPDSNNQPVLCTGKFLDDAGSCTTGFFPTGLPAAFPLASERAGLWTWSTDFRFGLNLLTLRTGAGFRELALPATWGPRDAGVAAWDTGAVIRSNVTGEQLAVLDRQGSFVLQRFPDGQLQSVTSEWVAVRTSAGHLVIHRR